MNTKYKKNQFGSKFKSLFYYTYKWMLLAIIAGSTIGSVCALFLHSLISVTQFRESHLWIISMLPLAGLLIGFIFYYYAKDTLKGVNLLLEEYQNPSKILPLKMAPLILAATLITHLFGGSAGREGTAVQIGGVLADRLTRIFRLNNADRKVIILLGITAGFAALFGTPWAAALFALELVTFSRKSIKSVIPVIMGALIADTTCRMWNAPHAHYVIPIIPRITVATIGYSLLAGAAFGLAAMLFIKSTHYITLLFNKLIVYPPLRPFVGGIILVLIIFLSDTTKFIGLGLPEINKAFLIPAQTHDWIIKIVFTALTLGAGFKGGEVTPLFFIGATLGGAMTSIIPLPLALLAGMGFVAVFSGAAKTPLASIIMGMELFGMECAIYLAIACLAAYFFSGNTGIYNRQDLRIK